MLRFKDYATKITASLQYHIENSIPLANNIYRTQHKSFMPCLTRQEKCIEKVL